MQKQWLTGILACIVVLWSAANLASAQGVANTTLLLVRHGEAYSNLPNPLHLPPEQLDALTPQGISEVTATGRLAASHPVVAVVASPTGRTRQTATIIAREAELKEGIAEDAAFASVQMGTQPDGSATTWEWRFSAWKAGDDPRPAGGESLADAAVRAVRAVQLLAARHPGKAIVVVTHSDIVAALLGHAVGTPVGQRYEKHKVPTGSVSEITISGDSDWKLVRQGWRPGS